MQTQTEARVRKRLPCTLSLEARQHNGMILNLSERGLFVQTSLPAEPGTLLDLDVRDPMRGRAIPLQAAVVWRRRVSPRMTGMNQSGMGLRLLKRPSEWRTLMIGLRGGEETTDDGGSCHATSAAEPGPALEATPAPPAHSFVVRLVLSGGPRSRRIVIESADEIAAASDALREVGAGWTVLEVRRR